MLGFSAHEKFVREVHKQLKECNCVAILYENSTRQPWPQMADKTFRERVMKILETSPYCVNPRFSPPDSYDDWTFSAYKAPERIEPGHCIVCNHAYIDQQTNRCMNISCEAQQMKPVSEKRKMIA